MNEALVRINRASEAEAESMFRDCCGSSEWARRMALSRPFVSEAELIQTAVTVWNELDKSDWLEAFASHPRIGETKAALSQKKQSSEWSSGEQAGMNSADEMLKAELAEANTQYFEKFGFIYIVCATGKSAEEMHTLCKQRLANDRETEVANAAAEQQKIIEIRLKKLLSQ